MVGSAMYNPYVPQGIANTDLHFSYDVELEIMHYVAMKAFKIFYP